MSKFRQLVEDIVHSQPKYQYLTPEMQAALYKEVENTIDRIDPSELSSASWDSNPYDVEPQLIGNSGTWNYDDDEMWNAACEKYIEYLEADGARQYLWDFIPEDMQEDDDFDQALTAEAINYIREQER